MEEYLGCASTFGCALRPGRLYEIESAFRKTDRTLLGFSQISNRDIFLRAVKDDTTLACPEAAEMPANINCKSPAIL